MLSYLANVNNLLRKIGWADILVLELDIDKQSFINLMQRYIDADDFNPFEGLAATNKPYKGLVLPDRFRLKAKQKAFDFKHTIAVVKGSYIESGPKLGVAMEITGFPKYILFLGVIMNMIVGPIVFYFLATKFMRGVDQPYILPVIIAWFIISLILLFIMGRVHTQRMKKRLSRDIPNWVAQHNTPPAPPPAV